MILSFSYPDRTLNFPLSYRCDTCPFEHERHSPLTTRHSKALPTFLELTCMRFCTDRGQTSWLFLAAVMKVEGEVPIASRLPTRFALDATCVNFDLRYPRSRRTGSHALDSRIPGVCRSLEIWTWSRG